MEDDQKQRPGIEGYAALRPGQALPDYLQRCLKPNVAASCCKAGATVHCVTPNPLRVSRIV
jgi:hypothetical protein